MPNNETFQDKCLREFDNKFWYINNKTMHEIHAPTCECRGNHSNLIKQFISKDNKKKDNKYLRNKYDRM